MAHQLGFFGAHRGGTQALRTLPDRAPDLLGRDWAVADPKDGRAEWLASRFEERFPLVRVEPRAVPAQHAIRDMAPDAAVLLAIDSLQDTRATLRERAPAQAATFQIVGRGPGGTSGLRFGVQGTILPGDAATSASAELLLGALDDLAEAASSRVITEVDPVAAAVLAPMRSDVTARSVRHLLAGDQDPWDLPGGPLGLTLTGVSFPMVVAPGAAQDRWRHHRDAALELVDAVPDAAWLDRGPLGRQAVVVIVVQPRIEILRVTRSRTGRRRVDGASRIAPVPKSAPAVFTD